MQPFTPMSIQQANDAEPGAVRAIMDSAADPIVTVDERGVMLNRARRGCSAMRGMRW